MKIEGNRLDIQQINNAPTSNMEVGTTMLPIPSVTRGTRLGPGHVLAEKHSSYECKELLGS